MRESLPRRRSGAVAVTAALVSVGLLIVALARPAPAHVRITTNLTWSEDVRPILRDRCMRCHRPGGIAPSYADFTTYGTDSQPGARAWATAIEEEILTGRMPPWTADQRYGRFANERRLSQREIDTIVAWVQGGAPQGPRRNLPPPPELTDEWLFGEPDLVVQPAEPFELPGGQVEGSARFEIPLEVEEPSWITGFEFKPANPHAVERMAAWIHDGEGEPEQLEVEIQVPYDPFRDEDAEEPTRFREMPSGQRLLGQYLRGDAPVLLPDGAGRRIRPGAVIELRIDYHRRTLEGNDQPLADRSRLGLYLAGSVEEVDLVSEAVVAGNESLEVDKKVLKNGASVETTLTEDVRLVGVSPHLGELVRGFEVTAHYPDGREKTLVLVPEVAEEWPSSYVFAEPLDAPSGTRIEMVGSFAEPEGRGGEQPFALWVDYTLDDHLVLPEVFEPADPAAQANRGGMLIGAFGAAPGNDAGVGGEGSLIGSPNPADPNAAAHMDHSPLHGGQFFMAPNMYHHLEGALYEGNVFRVFVYDDFKQPVDPRNFAGRIVIEHYDSDSGEFTEEDFPMAPVPGAEYLEGTVDTDLPAEFYAGVWLAGEQHRFDFYFTEYSKDVPAAPRTLAAGLPGSAEHSHERPPLTIPDQAAGIVAELEARARQVTEKIERGDWLRLYVPAFDGRDLAEALLGELDGLAPRDRGRVRKAVSRVMQSAADLDRAGDLGDAGRAREALDRFAGAVREIARSYGG
jgi:hypothetical protein